MKDQIKALRAATDETQQQLAQRLGVSISAVSSWETGRRQPTGLQLAALRRAMRKAGVDA